MYLIVISVTGTVATATSESNGEIVSIMMSTPTTVSNEMNNMLKLWARLCAMLSMSLVTRLRRSPRGVRSMYPSGNRLILFSTAERSRRMVR